MFLPRFYRLSEGVGRGKGGGVFPSSFWIRARYICIFKRKHLPFWCLVEGEGGGCPVTRLGRPKVAPGGRAAGAVGPETAGSRGCPGSPPRRDRGEALPLGFGALCIGEKRGVVVVVCVCVCGGGSCKKSAFSLLKSSSRCCSEVNNVSRGRSGS